MNRPYCRMLAARPERRPAHIQTIRATACCGGATRVGLAACIVVTLTTFCVAGCGGGSPDSQAVHSVGGSVSGLAGMDGPVLQDNGGR